MAPTSFSKITLPALVLGGAFVGHYGGKLIFGSPEMERLHARHLSDKGHNVESQKFFKY